MPVAAVNGQQINYTDSGGDDPVIIWSHGFLMNHTMFDPQVQGVAGWRHVAWDERGFGETPATGPFSYWDSANDAVALLDHLGVDQAVFAGMSQGGFLSLRAALAHPDRVRALVLIDTESGIDPPELIEGRNAMIDHWTSDAPLGDVGEFVAALILGDPALNEIWIADWESRRATFSIEVSNCLHNREDITDRMSEISCPALVVHGTADAAIAYDNGVALSKAIQGAQLAAIEGGSHAANLTHPAETNAAISGFLATL
ncbi:MAG: alpha/beta fold hydrolase [Acidimicrobiales bacterium]|jgi:3-oxoadipate enol-lactonase